ncbi:Transcriptional repressor EED/ESC/FIE, required for transcriptional silencing, WD repeat superfamily [Phaffia rhodozyma]|uniref:Transcriptional repressor EED/ESC/FIE, required for transcriptional silencing, WD repeat superfamily n=1 Tax=Phaffia rhodozyma TaxID=264483 RepID=A0A0F7SI64_PHARH|nr:Transcriptional repressor EED/ESC/FIE, required for transcriptional silencing, WD repeat superfamily [Phaffia rhodozyma]
MSRPSLSAPSLTPVFTASSNNSHPIPSSLAPLLPLPTPPVDVNHNVNRRARGPLNLRYVSRPAWYAPRKPNAQVERKKKLPSVDGQPNEPPTEKVLRHVQFSPWSPQTLRRFDITPTMISKQTLRPWQSRWVDLVKEWSNVAAVVESNGVLFLRLTAQSPYKVFLKIQEPEDEIYTVAWSYDPVRLQPIVAFCGRSNLIYVWRLSVDPGEPAERLRVLRGHGEEVYALVFHPSHPHVLASASKDTTIRLWNVFGSEPSVGAYRAPSVAQGNEGSLLIAVLIGQAPGGHLEGVTCLDFHPTLPLLVTGGLDYIIKIWPLPKLPSPFPKGAHKLFIGYTPLFSTKLLHDGIINSVLWHGEDTLISYQQFPAPKAIKWQWMGLRRHFPLGTDEKPIVRYAESNGTGLQSIGSQYAESKSRSMNILATYLPPIEAGPQRTLPDPSTSPVALSDIPHPFIGPEPYWISLMGRHLPFISTSPTGRPGSEITSSLIGIPLIGRLVLFDPDRTPASDGFIPPLTMKQKKSLVSGPLGSGSGAGTPVVATETENKEVLEENELETRSQLSDLNSSQVEGIQEKKEEREDSDLEVASDDSAPVREPHRRPGKEFKKQKQLKTEPVPQFEKPQEPYSILDCAIIAEGEELIGVSISPDGAKFTVGISRTGIHIWTLSS